MRGGGDLPLSRSIHPTRRSNKKRSGDWGYPRRRAEGKGSEHSAAEGGRKRQSAAESGRLRQSAEECGWARPSAAECDQVRQIAAECGAELRGQKNESVSSSMNGLGRPTEVNRLDTTNNNGTQSKPKNGDWKNHAGGGGGAPLWARVLHLTRKGRTKSPTKGHKENPKNGK
jgi:hypothetical protein